MEIGLRTFGGETDGADCPAPLLTDSAYCQLRFCGY